MEVIKAPPRMRTLDECYKELKEIDPNTAITKHFLRQLAIQNKVPCVMAGRKRLINLDKVIEYLNMSTPEKPLSSGIRAIKA